MTPYELLISLSPECPVHIINRAVAIASNLELQIGTAEITIQRESSGKYFINIGRDGYRKVAMKQPSYDHHWVAPIYMNDIIEVINGVPRVLSCGGDRGVVVGAYGILKLNTSSAPLYWEVNSADYKGGDRFWDDSNGKPVTMIMKVCEVQLLRLGFQNLFGGTYDVVELEKDMMKSTKESNLDFIHQHAEIAMMYVKDVGLNDMNTEEVNSLIEKIKAFQDEDDENRPR